MNKLHVGLIITAITLAAVAIVYVPQLREKQQHERDRSGTWILYRSTVRLAQLYLDKGNDEKTMEAIGEARELLEKGGCTDML